MKTGRDDLKVGDTIFVEPIPELMGASLQPPLIKMLITIIGEANGKNGTTLFHISRGAGRYSTIQTIIMSEKELKEKYYIDHYDPQTMRE